MAQTTFSCQDNHGVVSASKILFLILLDVDLQILRHFMMNIETNLSIL
jgi:hypothetical protein